MVKEGENAILENHILQDRARKEKADADLWEIEQREKTKSLVPEKLALWLMSDMVVKMLGSLTRFGNSLPSPARERFFKIWKDAVKHHKKMAEELKGKLPS